MIKNYIVVTLCVYTLFILCSISVHSANIDYNQYGSLNSASGEFIQIDTSNSTSPTNSTIAAGSPGNVTRIYGPPGMVLLNGNWVFGEYCGNAACLNGGQCNNGTQVTCNCAPGFTGEFCERNLCDNVSCPIGQKCSLGRCQVDRCFNVICRNDGTCNNGVCNCVNGFTGAFCQTHPCSLKKCSNGGICKLPGVCHCRNNFFGEFCELNACSTIRCANNGRCLYGKCICSSEWQGEFCTVPTDSARDHKILMDNLNYHEQSINLMNNRVDSVHNYTRNLKKAIRKEYANVLREYDRKVFQEAQEKSRRDFMTPKVRGPKPVRAPDLRTPNTPYENAIIYEDQTLAYHKGHEIRDANLKAALDLTKAFDNNITIFRTVIAQDVPGAEHVHNPFGTIALIEDKYSVDSSLLDKDLEEYHSKRDALSKDIMNAEDINL